MPPEQSKRRRPSVACASCRAARRACDGRSADCANYVPLTATASDAPGPPQPASPPARRPVRASNRAARSIPNWLRRRAGLRARGGDARQVRPTLRPQAAADVGRDGGCRGEQLASADWAADAVIEADSRTRSGKLGFEQADGRLMELLVLASASASPDAPLSLQLERWLAVWAKPPLRVR